MEHRSDASALDWPVGTTRYVPSKTDPSGKSYIVTRTQDAAYECTCWAFITQNKGLAKDKKTCKHLRDVLGDEHETSRTGQAPKAPKAKKRAAPNATSSMSSKASTSSAAPQGKKTRVDMSNNHGPARSTQRTTSISASRRRVAGISTSAVHHSASKGQPADLLLAHSFEFGGKKDPSGMLMSEKLDGVRAYWDGQGTLWSRTKKPFAAPRAFIAQLPRGVTLDGELYIGRDRFDETSGLVRTTKADAMTDKRWEAVKYMVFDIPSMATSPFNERLAELHRLFPSKAAGPVVVVEHETCQDVEHLDMRLHEIIHQDGEGLMLREPTSLYIGKRDKSLLKVKTFYDAEARVVAYEPGKGKYAGLVGSLICVMESNKQFLVGSGLTDARRANPPTIGSIITYRFQELSQNDVPRFPTFVGERHDAEGPKDAIVRSTATRTERSKSAKHAPDNVVDGSTKAKKSKSKAANENKGSLNASSVID